jgi:hypothetical protein
VRNITLVLLLVSCNLPPAAPPTECSADCGGLADCPALCAAIERLGCASAWGIDPGDGGCLQVCELAETEGPPLCPKLAATGSTCDEIDRLTECAK